MFRGMPTNLSKGPNRRSQYVVFLFSCKRRCQRSDAFRYNNTKSQRLRETRNETKCHNTWQARSPALHRNKFNERAYAASIYN